MTDDLQRAAISPAQTGDRTLDPEFERLVLEHQAAVFRTLARLVGRRDLVDDLAQEVFLRLFRALPGFRGEALIQTYLYRITVNVARDEWKRQRRTERRHVTPADDDAGWADRLPHPGPSPTEEMEQGEFARRVDEHLHNLRVVERTVLVLYHQEERSYAQIAEALSMPLGTVRTHLHRGRKHLREALLASRTIGGKDRR